MTHPAYRLNGQTCKSILVKASNDQKCMHNGRSSVFAIVGFLSTHHDSPAASATFIATHTHKHTHWNTTHWNTTNTPWTATLLAHDARREVRAIRLRLAAFHIHCRAGFRRLHSNPLAVGDILPECPPWDGSGRDAHLRTADDASLVTLSLSVSSSMNEVVKFIRGLLCPFVSTLLSFHVLLPSVDLKACRRS